MANIVPRLLALCASLLLLLGGCGKGEIERKAQETVALKMGEVYTIQGTEVTLRMEEVYETEPVYEVPEEKEEDQTTVEDDPQAYREELRQDAMAKEEWKEFCQKWQNFKKFIREAVTTLIQR